VEKVKKKQYFSHLLLQNRRKGKGEQLKNAAFILRTKFCNLQCVPDQGC